MARDIGYHVRRGESVAIAMYELFLTALPHLYGSIATIAIAGYLPQIYQLAKSEGAAAGVSLITWCIWLFTWLISLSYGAFILVDWRLCMIAGVNIAGHLGVIGLTAYQRYFRHKPVNLS
ncbi:MAG: hypothetical protein V4568_17905 [Pseudomonadota bacterium]